jgi:hypothetical protein
MTKKCIPTVDSMLAILAANPTEAQAFDAATAREYPQAADRREAVTYALQLLHAKQDAMAATSEAKQKAATLKRTIQSVGEKLRAQYAKLTDPAERSAYRRANWDKLCRK